MFGHRFHVASCALILAALVAGQPNQAFAKKAIRQISSIAVDHYLDSDVHLVQPESVRPGCPRPSPYHSDVPGMHYDNDTTIITDDATESISGEPETLVNPEDPATAGTPSEASEPRATMRSEQFAGLGSRQMTLNDAPGGYLDNPIVATWFRIRYDDARGANRPDRAEFFYPKCGCFPGAPGPTNALGQAASNVNYQDLSPYFEYALGRRFSVFSELTIRGVDIQFPSSNTTTTGFGDMNAGVKYALVANRDRYLTFQFKTYIPTGDADRGLGTNHVSLEPGLLYLSRLSNRSYFQGEFRTWVPVGGTSFAGNVLRYGVGLGYDLIRPNGQDVRQIYTSSQGLRVTAVNEFVGWTVLNGRETDVNAASGFVSASGDTIVNLKLGMRFTAGPGSLYAGWGHALTGDVWYKDLFRLEYRRMF